MPRRRLTNPLSVLCPLAALTLLGGVLLAPAAHSGHLAVPAPTTAPLLRALPLVQRTLTALVPPPAHPTPAPAPVKSTQRTLPHPPARTRFKGSDTSAGNDIVAASYTASTASSSRAYARSRLSATQYSCANAIFTRESGWNPRAYNPSSGAFGIPQALPAAKLRSAGADWRTNGATQVKWGLRYMKSRYGSPCGAWAFWQRHHWY